MIISAKNILFEILRVVECHYFIEIIEAMKKIASSSFDVLSATANWI